MNEAEHFANKIRPFVCEHCHMEMEARLTQNSTGHDAVRRQCATCGNSRGGFMPKRAFNISKLRPFDDEALAQFEAERRDEYDKAHAQAKALRKQKSDDWWHQYNTYLQSESWKKKREKVLDRDGGRCQACLDADAEQVHHLNYKDLGNELLFDLVAVCTPCHDRITESARKAREEVTPDDLTEIVRRIQVGW